VVYEIIYIYEEEDNDSSKVGSKVIFESEIDFTSEKNEDEIYSDSDEFIYKIIDEESSMMSDPTETEEVSDFEEEI